jgi:hypothetical protein
MSNVLIESHARLQVARNDKLHCLQKTDHVAVEQRRAGTASKRRALRDLITDYKYNNRGEQAYDIRYDRNGNTQIDSTM